MSLSILIPTYNYAAYSLAETLSRQAGRLSIPCEIIVADDASTDQVNIFAKQPNTVVFRLNMLSGSDLLSVEIRKKVLNILNEQRAEIIGQGCIWDCYTAIDLTIGIKEWNIYDLLPTKDSSQLEMQLTIYRKG